VGCLNLFYPFFFTPQGDPSLASPLLLAYVCPKI
jgi:hypothetical protein